MDTDSIFSFNQVETSGQVFGLAVVRMPVFHSAHLPWPPFQLPATATLGRQQRQSPATHVVDMHLEFRLPPCEFGHWPADPGAFSFSNEHTLKSAGGELDTTDTYLRVAQGKWVPYNQSEHSGMWAGMAVALPGKSLPQEVILQ